ncbi:MAG: type II toxin-antitoxin system prevent-host-death family antitoxin [Verrucomicrobia bacterium]|nr:type II toxin-antitoxin system prevent-host-death family antitoxin [Verrucomicrobiota bacterium]
MNCEEGLIGGILATFVSLLDTNNQSDHYGHMITNLKTAKSRLSELVEKASTGEEIWLTVRGSLKARICPLPEDQHAHQKMEWLKSMRELRKKHQSVNIDDDSQSLWDDLRGE